MEEEEGEAGECNNDASLTRPSLGGSEYDDELGVPESLIIVDVGDGPVVIERSDEEIEGKFNTSHSTYQNSIFKMMYLMVYHFQRSTNHQSGSNHSNEMFLFRPLILQ